MRRCCSGKKLRQNAGSRILTLDTLPGSQIVPEGWIADQQKCGLYYILCFFRQPPPKFDTEELQVLIRRLHKYCLVHLQDPYKVHINRTKGISLLNLILLRGDFVEIRPLQVMSLVWCTLSCIHHFYVRLRVGRGLIVWTRRRQSNKAMKTYEMLLDLTVQYHFESIVNAMMTFFTDSGMWNLNDLCTDLVKRLLLLSEESEPIVHAILDVTEKAIETNINEARQIVRVFYQVMEDHVWTSMEDDLIERLLMLFLKSVKPDSSDAYIYMPLRRGLEVSLRNILMNMSNSYLLKIESISDDALLDFGNVLEYAALLHHTYSYKDSLQSNVFPLILELISSEDRIHSLLGSRVLQYLLDRHSNKGHFDTPRIFFDDAHFNITIGEYRSDDKSFLRKYREMIHTTLLASIQMHGAYRINLESTYTLIAILVVEVPCGYTAAAVVCLAMAIQEYALSNDEVDLETGHRLHSAVMAIMSLVCWVHSATVFYDYLKIIVKRRAQFAPHLNPPLRSTYEYAQHHILWNKPELFFEDWEARYGLWKCFRTRKSRRATKVENLTHITHNPLNT